MITSGQVIADNRKAHYDYELQDTYEAGIALRGTEVKSLRLGQCSIKESHIAPKDGEIWLFNANIAEYQQAGTHLQHQPTRPRKLLLHKREINKILGSVAREGMTVVANKIFFDDNGRVKLEIALAKGKKTHDKRETEKKRDWGKQKQRLLRGKH
ncbi:MAG: SsrA-binding protein SmpB [Alphaproteobacteria bacterium]